MDRYKSASIPMDFEYTNRTGPVDNNSPFMVASRARQQEGQHTKKRPFESYITPSQTPSLRDPNNHTFLFSQHPTHNFGSPSKVASHSTNRPGSPIKSPLKDPRFQTPRKLDLADVSSPEDTPGADTDANNADSEATPDTSSMGFRNRAVNFMAGGRSKPNNGESPSKRDEKPESWTSKLGRLMVSPEPKSKSGGGPFTNKGEKRILRRRNAGESTRKPSGRSRRINSSHMDSSDDESSNRKTGPHIPLWRTFLDYIDDHPDLPNTLSFYVQLGMNVFWMGCVMYVVYAFWSAVQGDVNIAADKAMTQALAEMAKCAQDFKDNDCGGRRMPALENACMNWEQCMKRDPKAVGRARVSAHTFATIFNSFVEPISYKAFIFFAGVLSTAVIISNFALYRFRVQHPLTQNAPNPSSHPQPPYDFTSPYAAHQQHHYLTYGPGSIPPTPQRHPSAGGMGYPATPGNPRMIGEFFNTPATHGQWYGGQEAMTGQRDGRQPAANGSPTKKIEWSR
ncbi:Di-sulfide bridge nucleocytoplasmic transport domain-containing protein [Phyllosticta citribraziliensis]|uniref:Di-sulfide bridge nucleocytoplasmic transport domain-containing protein n=1 Tax=Phyllosticta citribraziliensis TaxID=989973 RepID=A0ABR1LFB5_9PEZI